MRDFADQHETRQDFSMLFRVLKYLKPFWKQFLASFLLMIIVMIPDLLLPLISGLAIEMMALPAEEMVLSTKITILIWGSVGYVFLLIISFILGYYQQMILQRIGQKVTLVMRNEVFNHIEHLSIGQINQLPVGKLVTRVNNDPNSISEMFTSVIVNMIRSAVTLIAFLIIMFIINWQMTLVVLIVLPLILVLSLIFRKYSRKAYRTVRNDVSEINAYLSENLSGMKITQVFNQETKKKKAFNKLNNKLRNSYFIELLVFSIYRPLIYFLSMAGTIITIYVGIDAVLSGTLLVGLFIAFYWYIQQFFEPIQQIAEQYNNLQNGFSSAEKIFDVLDTKPDIVDDVDAIELEAFKGAIEFKNVWFSYIEDEWVLKDVSFSVKPDETVAFVGATGSGKTTILGLIVRNYDIQKGQILIDGIDIRKIKRSSLRSFIGQMLQDVFLFSGTIKDNITLREDSISDEEIAQAIDYVGLDYVLNKLPDGLNHEVLERGNNFSSGERQLISFARAIVYKPTLMILDEATANIDSETEQLIQASLKKMMEISTMLIVAHRLSTIQHCDKIIVMQKGEIKESGNHQALLNQKGLYYKLYQLQFDKEESESYVE